MKFPLIDLHQDLLAHINYRETYGQNVQTSFELIKSAQAKIVVSTAFPVPPNENYLDPITNDLIEKDFRDYVTYTQTTPGWTIIRNASDISRVMNGPDLNGLILHIEGLNVVSDNDWDRLAAWYKLGWRSLGPVWNITNPLGGGTTDTAQGLTDLGRKMINWLQERHMLVDFAHMNAPTFWDALKIVQGPILISHGNAHACCPNPRNYTDEQLKVVAERNDVVGVFFARTFVTGRNLPGSVVDAADHIDHLRNIMGIEHVALGTDFGGIISGTLEGLASLEELFTLWEELERRNYSHEDMEKIAWKNAARIPQTIL